MLLGLRQTDRRERSRALAAKVCSFRLNKHRCRGCVEFKKKSDARSWSGEWMLDEIYRSSSLESGSAIPRLKRFRARMEPPSGESKSVWWRPRGVLASVEGVWTVWMVGGEEGVMEEVFTGNGEGANMSGPLGPAWWCEA